MSSRMELREDVPFIKTPKKYRKQRIFVWILITITLATFGCAVVGKYVWRTGCPKLIREHGVKIASAGSMAGYGKNLDKGNVVGIAEKGEGLPDNVGMVSSVQDGNTRDKAGNGEYPFDIMDPEDQGWSNPQGTMDSTSGDFKPAFEITDTEREDENPEVGTMDSASEGAKPEFDIMDILVKNKSFPYFVMDYEDENVDIWRYRYQKELHKNGTKTNTTTTNKWRLPKDVVPKHYDLEMKPHLEGNFTFEGKVEILLTVEKKVSAIVLHASAKFGLHVHNDTIALSPSKNSTFEGVAIPTNAIRPTESSLDFEKELLILKFHNPLEVGSYKLKMKFHGTLNHSDFEGFYISRHVNEKNQTELQAVTQFSPVKARTAFPCFDEPAMKATFVVTIVHKKGLKSMSNTLLANSTDRGNDWVADTFEKTVKLPTYLVAFVVSDFGFKGDPKKFAAWSRKDVLNQLDLALQVGPKLLAHFEKLFRVKLDLKKIEIAAIPEFLHAAMENWGLVTFKERALLYDPTDHVHARRLRVVNVMAHEFAHLWFGDLVTPAWWNDLWVKEGFATYFEVFGMAGVLENFDFAQYFVINNMQNTFLKDIPYKRNTVSLPVLKPDEIVDRFDEMSYTKPSCLLRMTRAVLGDEAFFNGLNKYLTKHSYGNTVQDDVFEAFNSAQTASNKVDVKKIMDTWTLQRSHPIVKVTRDYINNTSTFSQDIIPGSIGRKKYSWHIPVSMTDGKNPNMDDVKPKFWLTTTKAVTMKVAEPQYWILINVQQTGYYRVSYDPKNWQLLYAQLRSDYKKINVLNRAQIIDDTFKSANLRYISYVLAMNVTLYLENEIQYAPMKSFLSNFKKVDDRLKNKRAFYTKFNTYFNKKLGKALKLLGWEDKADDSLLTKMVRADLITWLTHHEDKPSIDKARSLFKQYKENPNSNVLYPDIQLSVFCAEVSEGGNQSYQYVMDNFEKVQKPNQRDRLIASLGCVKDEVLLKTALDKCLKDVRFYDGCYKMFAMATKQFSSQKLMLNYIDAKFARTSKRFNKEKDFMKLFKNIVSTMATASDLTQISEFMMNHNIADDSFNVVAYNKFWLKVHFRDVKMWLEEFAES